ncbi:transposase family protein [Carnobacteriaceae bacterium zg-84]|nr:transposase family protein [Carnobacteriaceae bacterium zg-84]
MPIYHSLNNVFIVKPVNHHLQRNPHVDKHCFITNRLKQKIIDTLTETISETYIAKQHNVSCTFR